jgi:hypothetical protein
MDIRNVFLSVLLTCVFLFGLVAGGYGQESHSLKDQSLQTMQVLNRALLKLQIIEKNDVNHGALNCAQCNILRSRAAEAVFPFAMEYKQTDDNNYLRAAIHLGNWLIRQQFPDGGWKETPEDWTGTTADQLLMMAQAYPIVLEHLTAEENAQWKNSIRKAAEYLVQVMSPDFASINYCATTTASLMAANQVVPDADFISKANAPQSLMMK